MMNGTPPRGKPLPTRSGQDSYGGGGGAGYPGDYASRGNGGGEPNGRTVLEGYRQDILNGFREEEPLYNPLNTTRPQSSMLLNVNDPIQVHLLVETALGDSKEYEILSSEEVDDLKKQISYLTQRIEQTRNNLAIQSKYRDAAISMSRLYSSAGKGRNGEEKKRRSLLGHSRNGSQESREADQERIASERRCEELASELWGLEKRIMEPKSRLLRHTAGILQMTHKGPVKTTKGSEGALQGAIPGSPESMYTYHNARNSLEFISEENLFDERSLYRSADGGLGLGFGDDGARDDGFGKGPTKEQMQMIADTELRLEDLNTRLRAVLVKTNPKLEGNYGPPPAVKSTDDAAFGNSLQTHLNYLEKSITTIDQEQDQISRQQRENNAAAGNMEQTEAVMMGLWEIIRSGEEEARQRKRERRQTRAMQNLPDDEDESPDEGDDLTESFSLQGFSTKVQWLYTQATKLKEQKKVLQRQIKQQRELNSKSDATKDAELAQKIEELARTKDLLTRTENDADLVREQLSQVMDQLDEARHQESMREQARSTDESPTIKRLKTQLAEKIKELADFEEQLQEFKDDFSITNAESQAELREAEARIASLTQELAAASTSQKSLESQVAEKGAELEKKEKEMEDMNMEVARLQTEVTIARAELDGAYGSRAQRAAEVAANPAIQKEIDDLNVKNRNLAAEITQLREQGTASSETDEKMKLLKKELEETIEEYELMTKASIEWEKEREQLDATIDKLRDDRERLEAELSDEKVRWLGMRSPGADGTGSAGVGGGIGSTSTTVLKNEFKKMMRDTRAENTKALRHEQAERRKLEEELRALKKLHRPGKSSLSQSFASSS